MSFKLLAEQAIKVGFQMVGVSTAKRPATFDAFSQWIELGMFAGMNYLANNHTARENPNFILNGVKSIIMLGVSFDRVLSNSSNEISKINGIVDYAQGVDYHLWIKKRFKPILSLHRELYPDDFCRGVVDTAPLLEREFAVNAGLGQIGKNTMLITSNYGSNVFLAAILTTVNLSPTTPIFETITNKTELKTNINNFCNENYYSQNSPCGDCNKCLKICPTNALTKPYMLDARLCLNYWTIEHQGEIPEQIRQKLNGRFFGCDTCRKICPYNKPFLKLNDMSKLDSKPESKIDPNSLDQNELLKISKGTPLERKLKRQLKKI
jgi:epoxyqueuosine reductase